MPNHYGLGPVLPCAHNRQLLANYSGWAPGQLEGEFNWDSWITLPADLEHVFWTGERDLWNVVVSKVNAQKLSEFLGLRAYPADPTLN